MSDLADFRAMLDKAKIPHSEWVRPAHDEQAGLHHIDFESVTMVIDSDKQPIPGGYMGFFSMLMFRSSDGALVAVWAEE